MIVESRPGWTDMIGVVVGLVLGFVSSQLTDYIRDRTKRSRLLRAMQLEIEVNRTTAVALMWSMASAERAVDPTIAQHTLVALNADPIRAERINPGLRTFLATLVNDPAACAKLNANVPPGEHWVTPLPLATVVYSANTEILGYVKPELGRAIMNCYAAIPSINSLVADMQASIARRVTVTDSAAVRQIENRLTADQRIMRGAYTILIADCDQAISLLS